VRNICEIKGGYLYTPNLKINICRYKPDDEFPCERQLRRMRNESEGARKESRFLSERKLAGGHFGGGGVKPGCVSERDGERRPERERALPVRGN